MIRGFATLIPIAVTIYLIFWLVSLVEGMTQKILMALLPEGAYFTGMGFLVLVAAMFVIGLAMCEIHTEQVFRYFEKHFTRIPVVKSIYGVSKDFMDYFARQRRHDEFGQVVSVNFPALNIKMVGFVTREDVSDESEALEEASKVLVYLPMGYQIGGYSIAVERKQVEVLDMNFEDAMRFILTAGVSRETHENTELVNIPTSQSDNSEDSPIHEASHPHV